MSFDEMWGQARNDALARQQSSMRLNQLPATEGGGAGGAAQAQLHVDASLLEGRAKNAETVRKNFMDADNKVMSATSEITLKGFKSESAITTFQKRWRSQMRHMEDLLQNGVKGNLETSAAAFRAEEAKRLSKVKRLSDGEKEN
ncbi:hypothetical protein ACFV2D_31105 [Streptomyces capillispiralis]|uniref:hypothetical protein n=1 Tax=Streptomyces capillispiralis TaxID=68182 RepID=UPI00368905A2